MRRLSILLGLFLALPLVAAAQENSKFELFGGYTYTRISDSNTSTANANGGTGDIGFFPLKWVGLVGQVAYTHSDGYTYQNTSFTAPTNTLTYAGGPRIRFSTGRITPYVQVLFGGVHRSNLETSSANEIAGPETSLAYSVGGGVDLKLVHHISVRLIQVNFIRSSLGTKINPSETQNDFNLQTGIVIH
jgi:opacity protein-like surface antigen